MANDEGHWQWPECAPPSPRRIALVHCIGAGTAPAVRAVVDELRRAGNMVVMVAANQVDERLHRTEPTIDLVAVLGTARSAAAQFAVASECPLVVADAVSPETPVGRGLQLARSSRPLRLLDLHSARPPAAERARRRWGVA